MQNRGRKNETIAETSFSFVRGCEWLETAAHGLRGVDRGKSGAPNRRFD